MAFNVGTDPGRIRRSCFSKAVIESHHQMLYPESPAEILQKLIGRNLQNLRQRKGHHHIHAGTCKQRLTLVGERQKVTIGTGAIARGNGEIEHHPE